MALATSGVLCYPEKRHLHMNRETFNIKVWILLALAVGGFAGVSHLLSRTTKGYKPQIEELKQQFPPSTRKDLKEATLSPGRVVQLNTSKGVIKFVLFEKDCPKTTKRIAELVDEGCYDHVKFGRVEKDTLIQTTKCKKDVPGMETELAKGMTHAKGSVGMARVGRDYESNTSAFYILLEPQPHLDMEYTNFGRLIRGMDVAMRIEEGDVIESAQVRPLTDADRQRFFEVLKIESDRRTD